MTILRYCARGNIVFLFLLALALVPARCSAEENFSPPKAGEQAPDFTLVDMEGESFSLARSLEEKNAVLLWFTNLCGG
jgi:cytochrome oxidase Cu insertion factor (SCO1/SenC/PrrC family)